jgi:uncharacterized damage-inducible protein DinB
MALQSYAALAEIRDSVLETYASNDAMNQLILSNLDRRAWRAHPPGKKGSGRTIAAIFAHLHNSRLVWLKNSAPHLKCPPPLDPDRCTMKQAAAAHRRSAAQCLRMLSDALSAEPNRRVKKFSRGSWSQTWPAGGTMFAYMFSHEAHHRGQILMLAHQVGYRVLHDTPGIWHWEKLWKKKLTLPRARAEWNGPKGNIKVFPSFADGCSQRMGPRHFTPRSKQSND